MTNVAQHTETVVLGPAPRPNTSVMVMRALSTRKPSPLIPRGRPDDGSQPTKRFGKPRIRVAVEPIASGRCPS